jgi:hypothetical protein
VSYGHRLALGVTLCGALVLAVALAAAILWADPLFIVFGLVAAGGAATTAAVFWRAGSDPNSPASRQHPRG